MPDIIISGISYNGISKIKCKKTDKSTATFVDTSADTVSADKLVEGVTAHDSKGALIVGTYVAQGTVLTFSGNLKLSADGTLSAT
jgi:hypothetical protein